MGKQLSPLEDVYHKCTSSSKAVEKCCNTGTVKGQTASSSVGTVTLETCVVEMHIMQTCRKRAMQHTVYSSLCGSSAHLMSTFVGG